MNARWAGVTRSWMTSSPSVGVSDEEYRDYIRQEVLRGDFQQYFKDKVVTRYQPQREVAQIFLNLDQGQPVPKLRVRHLLVQPIPGAQDQSGATAAQWRAARQEAEKLRQEAEKQKDGQWWELAAQSDDPGSATRGGYLGWYDPAHAGAAVRAQVRQGRHRPARSARSASWSAPSSATTSSRSPSVASARRSRPIELATQVQQDPDSFADVAEAESEDVSSARDGGDLGWIIPYQYDAARDEAIFGMTEPGEISDPVVTGSGIYIYKLLDSADQRYVPQDQRDQVGTSGFNRWLDEMRNQAGVWVDSEFNAPSTGAAG